MVPNFATCAQAAGFSMLDSDQISGSSVINEFPAGYLSCSHNIVIRVSPGIVPREQAPTIKFDRLV